MRTEYYDDFDIISIDIDVYSHKWRNTKSNGSAEFLGNKKIYIVYHVTIDLPLSLCVRARAAYDWYSHPIYVSLYAFVQNSSDTTSITITLNTRIYLCRICVFTHLLIRINDNIRWINGRRWHKKKRTYVSLLFWNYAIHFFFLLKIFHSNCKKRQEKKERQTHVES